MPKLTIDQRPVEVAPGTTLLAAARRLGIEIPTLCYLEGYEPSTSCLVCMVKIRNQGRLVPSCATVALEGMEVESETEEVHAIRRTALELLLSDHVGDCLAPCHFACPAHMDIPLMLRQITADNLRQAIVTVKKTIALPAVLGRVCPKPCEKGCRRSGPDHAVAVCGLKRYVADQDLASAAPYHPACQAATGKRVAIVGAGPTGLSAAYYLRQQGHAVTIYDDQPQPGGRLRREAPEELPADVLDAEIATILGLGIDLVAKTRVAAPLLDELRQGFDAVLIACGSISKDAVVQWGMKPASHGIHVEKETYATGLAGVFAAGNAIRAKGLVVRSVADGHEVAAAIHQYLCGQAVQGLPKAFSSRIGKMESGEVLRLISVTRPTPWQEIPARVTAAQAAEQAGRCLHCDCRSLSSCALRRYAEQYGADAGRFKAQRAPVQQVVEHSHVIFEPGKCIRCGLCIQIAERAGEPLGLTFIGRGFDVRIGVPLDRSFAEALAKTAAECVAACPTAALALKADG